MNDLLLLLTGKYKKRSPYGNTGPAAASPLQKFIIWIECRSPAVFYPLSPHTNPYSVAASLKLSTVEEMYCIALSNVVAAGHMWLLSLRDQFSFPYF